MPRYFTAAEDAMVLSLPSAEVQRRTGRSLKTIGVRRNRLKRMGFKVQDQRTSTERLKTGRSVWTPEADELVRQLRPYEVAKQVGVSPATTQRRRTALGLPPIGRFRLPPRTTPKLVKRKWTKAELRIALALPPGEALAKLPGRTRSSIHAVRFHQKRKGAKFKAAKRGRKRG